MLGRRVAPACKPTRDRGDHSKAERGGEAGPPVCHGQLAHVLAVLLLYGAVAPLQQLHAAVRGVQLVGVGRAVQHDGAIRPEAA